MPTPRGPKHETLVGRKLEHPRWRESEEVRWRERRSGGERVGGQMETEEKTEKRHRGGPREEEGTRGGGDVD